MQRFNFQFTGQQFHRIENGRLVGQLRDVAYQATTTDFWGSMEAVGGPQTYVLGGAFNCGKGQPGQVAAVSHGCPAALFRGVNVLNTAQRGRPMMRRRPQELVERALAASTADGCIVIAAEHTETNLRWAGNSLTTNGQMRSRSVTVISTVRRRPGGTSAGVVTRAVTAGRDRRRWCAPPSRPAATPRPADDAAPARRATTTHDDDWDAEPATTERRGLRAASPRRSAPRSPLGRAATSCCSASPSTR